MAVKSHSVLNRKKYHRSDFAEMFSEKNCIFFDFITAVIGLRGGTGKQEERK